MNKLLYFTAKWCAPCRGFSPVFEKFKENNKNVQCEKIDVDEAQELTTQYNIKSIPALVFLQDDKEFKRHIGPMKEDQLKLSFEGK